MRRSRKLLLVIVLVVAAAGLAYLIFGLVYVPGPAQFQVTGVLELGRTEFRRGETITVEPFLTYTGMRRVDIFRGTPFLFVAVYTADDARVLELPVLELTYDIGLTSTLRPNVPYNEEYHWTRWYFPDYLRTYSFKLEQPGDYKVVVRAEFRPDMDRAREYRVYSEPIWITIAG